MSHLIAFVSGGLLVGLLWAALHRRRQGAPAEPIPVRIEPRGTNSIESLAGSVSRELADLATSIGGHAQLLCEAVKDPIGLAPHTEKLWQAVRRLRTFSEKVQASAGVESLELRPTDLGDLLASLRFELEGLAGGLKVECRTAPTVPLALTEEDTLRRAVMVALELLRCMEPHAHGLSVRASNSVSDDHEPCIELTLQVESEQIESETDADTAHPRVGTPVDRAAATNLARALGIVTDFEHCPGLRATARLWIPAAPCGAPAAEPELPSAPEVPHPFGGVLLLDDDSLVRDMIQRELAKTGRRVVCADGGSAARSLLDATPERFELFILDADARGTPGVQIAEHAATRCPEARILLLTTCPLPVSDTLEAARERWIELRKPFGVTELRDAVCSLLGVALPITPDA